MTTGSPSHALEAQVASALIAASHDALAAGRAVPVAFAPFMDEEGGAGGEDEVYGK